VYLAHDTKLDRDVAVALIKTEGLDSDGLSRVRREAQAMGRLGDHPHIVTVFDIGEDESTTDSRQAPQPYIVSQYMAGGDLASVLDKAEGRRLPLAEALRMADQVCQGLEHAHSHGIIHRDLKPGNIWLTEPSTPSAQADAKIGDFGLAVALDRSRLTVAGMMVGTASYMPPEQAVGGEASRLSDLYALGCVLYEMMTGRPPFVGDDTVAVISQHLNTAPVAPTWHNSECPAGVEALILRLLEKDPGQRPAGADEVRQALTTAARASTSAPEPAAAAPEAANPIYRRTFVGREQELKQLEQAFDAALSGHSRLLMVVGEPGIGKTTLTEQLATYSGMRGGQTLVGHCYEEGSLSLPYLPFVEAMRTYTTSHDPDALLKQLGSGAAELARIVSEIRDKIQVDLPAPGSPEEERFRLFQAVTTFLRNAANVQPLCIVLEDLHDADKGTLDMLVHLARNLGRARVLLVGTYRDVEVDRTHPLSPALAELRRLESFQRIPLRGLSPDEVQRMLSNIAGQEVPYVLAEAIYRQTEGNPLFIQELIRNAAEEGLIKREGGQWIVTVDSLLNYIPEGLRDVIGRRLSRLSDSCNRILSVAAVIGRDFAVPVLQQVAGVSEEDMLLALEEATRVSLIEEMRGGREIRYRFTHAFFRQTLYEEMIAPRRLRMHNEVAKSLEAHYQGHLQEHAAELAEHFSHSSTEEDLQKAVEYGELAAERATSVYAFGEAARLLEQALEVQDVLGSRDDAKRYDLLMELAACLLSGGEPKRLFESVAPEAFAIAERLGGGVRAARAAEQAVWAALYHWGSVSFVMPEYRAWCERVDKHAPPESRERVMADCFISWTHWTLKDQETCWQLRRHALELARRIGDPDALSYAMFSFIVVGGPIDWEEERFQVAQELRDVPRSGLAPVLLSQMLYSLAEIFVNHGDRATADRYWSELDEYVKRVPDPYAHSWQVLCESYRLLMRGEHEKVVEVSQELAANATALGIELWGQLMGAWSASGALTDLGRYEELLASQWTWGSLPHGDAVIAFQLALMGRTDEAREKVRKVTTERGIGKPDDLIEGATLVVLLQAAVLAADVESTSLLYERLKGMDDWYAVKIMTSGRALGTAAALLGDPEAARRHLLAGLELAKQIEDRPETAWVRLALAGLLFEHFPDERAEAAEHLNLAVREFRDMKMQPALEDAMRLKLKFQGITSSDVYTSLDTVARVVQEEKPDLRPHAAPDGTVTILFSDIEGSTQMADRLGDKQFMEVLREHNAIVRSKVQKYEGFEVKSEGDGFMVAFQSARRAVDCAMGVQIALAERNEDAAQAVNVRMGLHAGETIREGEDFFGKNVILAARIASQARGGQILVSSLLKALVDSAGDLAFDEGREIELKGLSGTHRMHEVLWSRDGERPAEAALEPAPSVSAAIDQAEVRYCTTEDGVRVAYTMYGEGPAIVFAPYFTESFSMQNEIPEERDFYAQLGKGRTVVRYDGRGTGLSERDVGDCSHESMVRDLESVVKATGLRDFALWGQVLAGPRAIEFATRHPELRLRLILVSTFAKAIEVMPRAQIEALVTLSRTNWDLAAQLFADVVGREQSDANVRRGTLFRESASGEVAAMMLEGIYEADVTDLLPLVKAPTLILQRANDNLFRMDFGKTMAAAIPNARLVPLEGETVMYDPRDVAAIVQAVDNFLSEG
jgi:serine/threonine protein kinase/class 3 adenylate cyclase/pimeloyl-ACP methyl ester carboxylesterase